MFTFATNLFTHSANEVTLSIRTASEYAPRGQRWMVKRGFTLQGVLLLDGASNITAGIQALEEGYPGLITFAGLYDQETGITAHYLSDSDDCFGGIRVTQLAYPKGDASEYVTGREFTISLEADFLDFSGEEMLEFDQTITRKGTGGPRQVVVETLTGPVVRQTTNQKTIQTVTQSGRAVGLNKYPTPPKPLYPQFEIQPERSIVEKNPETRLGKQFRYERSWSYLMQF